MQNLNKSWTNLGRTNSLQYVDKSRQPVLDNYLAWHQK